MSDDRVLREAENYQCLEVVYRGPTNTRGAVYLCQWTYTKEDWKAGYVKRSLPYHQYTSLGAIEHSLRLYEQWHRQTFTLSDKHNVDWSDIHIAEVGNRDIVTFKLIGG